MLSYVEYTVYKFIHILAMVEEQQLRTVTIKSRRKTPTAMCKGADAAGDGKYYLEFTSENK